MLYFKHKLRRREKIVWKKVKDIIKTQLKAFGQSYLILEISFGEKIICVIFFLSFLGIQKNYTENSVVRMYHSIWWRKGSVAPMDTSQKGTNPATAYCLKSSHWPDEDPFRATELLTWFLNPIHWAQKSSSRENQAQEEMSYFHLLIKQQHPWW